MGEPPKSQTRFNFEKYCAAKKWAEAVQEYNGLDMTEMLFSYQALPDKAPFRSACEAAQKTINLPRMKYAWSVVDDGQMPDAAPPGDLRQTGQEEDAREYLAPVAPKLSGFLFSDMNNNYPQGSADQVKQSIGGSVNDPNIENTCAVRMSKVLNYSVLPVPSKIKELYVVQGADKKNYALRQKELRAWIRKNFGPPNFSFGPGEPARRKLKNLQGIIGFDIKFDPEASGYAATGHVDLWDGATFQHEAEAGKDYFALATRIEFWRIKSWRR